MRALVTGATGFTGGHLVRCLRAHGDDVVALVRCEDARARRLAEQGCAIRLGDLADRESLHAAVQGVDVVYNVAASYRQAAASADTYGAVNAEAVGWLVDAAAQAGVRRVMHCSTVGVHGDVEHPPANEDAPLRPGDEYQRSKLRGEELGRSRAAATGVEFVVARPSGIYGPGDQRLFKLFGAVARGRFVQLGAGEIYYHLTYVTDVAEGFRLCGTVPGAAAGTFIIAGEEVARLRELVQLTASIAGVRPPRVRLPVWPVWLAGAVCEAVCVPLGVEPVLYRRRVDFFTKSRSFDIRRAKAVLGFRPAVSLQDGIRLTLDWYRQEGWLR